MTELVHIMKSRPQRRDFFLPAGIGFKFLIFGNL